VPKTSSSDVTGVAPSGLGCAAWRLRVRCQVIKENQRSLKRMAPGGKWIPPIGKYLVEALESTWRLAVRSVLPSDNYRHGHQRRVCV